MSSPVSPLTNVAAVSSRPASPPNNSTDALANKDTFLKLLVAQIRNQNPLSPQDGVQFLNQLTQFSGLEQNLQMRQDLDSMLQVSQQTLDLLKQNSVPRASTAPVA